MSEQDATHYRAPDGTVYRIYTEPDTDASSPRDDCDNVSTLVTWDSRWLSPDRTSGTATDDEGLQEVIERDDTDDRAPRILTRYVNLFRPDILAAVPLVRNGYDGTIATDPDGTGYHVGVAYVTAKDWQTCMGDTPVEGVTGPDGRRVPSALEAIEQDIATYNSWATGEYVGFIVERRARWSRDGAWEPAQYLYTWEDYESCWGFDGEAYAIEQAAATLPDGSVEINANELDDILASTV